MSAATRISVPQRKTCASALAFDLAKKQRPKAKGQSVTCNLGFREHHCLVELALRALKVLFDGDDLAALVESYRAGAGGAICTSGIARVLVIVVPMVSNFGYFLAIAE